MGQFVCHERVPMSVMSFCFLVFQRTNFRQACQAQRTPCAALEVCTHRYLNAHRYINICIYIYNIYAYICQLIRTYPTALCIQIAFELAAKLFPPPRLWCRQRLDVWPSTTCRHVNAIYPHTHYIYIYISCVCICVWQPCGLRSIKQFVICQEICTH